MTPAVHEAAHPGPPSPATTMKARRIGWIELDDARLEADFEIVDGIEFDRTYEAYALGSWRSCSLWNMTGDAGDGLSYEYEGAAKLTRHGGALPYIRELAVRHFRMDRCKSARIFALEKGQLAPHRDYLEFKRGFTRVHLVLKTTDGSYNSDESTVYRMNRGEVWYVDGTPVHAAANFSDEPRFHLIMDFDPDLAPEDTARSGVRRDRLPPPEIVARPPLRDDVLTGLLSLSGVIDDEALLLRQMLPLLTGLHYAWDVSSRDSYFWLEDIARRSGVARAVELAREIRNRYIGAETPPSAVKIVASQGALAESVLS